jgi:hypothetical protein
MVEVAAGHAIETPQPDLETAMQPVHALHMRDTVDSAGRVFTLSWLIPLLFPDAWQAFAVSLTSSASRASNGSRCAISCGLVTRYCQHAQPKKSNL